MKFSSKRLLSSLSSCKVVDVVHVSRMKPYYDRDAIMDEKTATESEPDDYDFISHFSNESN